MDVDECANGCDAPCPPFDSPILCSSTQVHFVGHHLCLVFGEANCWDVMAVSLDNAADSDDLRDCSNGLCVSEVD